MKSTRELVLPSVLLLLVAAASGCKASRAPALSERADRVPDGEMDFYHHLRMIRQTIGEPPESTSALMGSSKLTVLGEIVAVRDGREHGSPDNAYRTRTATLEVRVKEVVSGTADATIYVEVRRGVLSPIEQLDATMPSEDILFFLVDAIQQEGQWQHEDRGRPKGAPLYTLNTQLGMMVDDPIGVIHPLVVDRSIWTSKPADSSLEGMLAGLRGTRER